MTPNPVPSREAVDKQIDYLERSQTHHIEDWRTIQINLLRDLRAEVERLTKFNQDMVAKAAEGSLDGYRELGQRAAQAENERDSLRATVSAQAAELEKVRKAATEIETWLKSYSS